MGAITCPLYSFASGMFEATQLAFVYMHVHLISNASITQASMPV